jgi:hypothetical protein
VNDFIAGRQHALHNADDAFFRQRGDGAIRAAPEVDRMLRQMREATLEQAANDDQRQLLARRLDAQMRDAGDVIGRHVAAQSLEWQRDIAAARQALIRNAFELEADDDDKLIGLAEAYATAARELARIDGAPDGGAATVAEARSSIWRGAIDRRLSIGEGPQALALFGRVQSQLSPADRLSLDTPLQVVRLDQEADNWIARQDATDERPLQQRIDADPDLSPDARHVVRAKVDARDTDTESARVSKVQELDDRTFDAARTLATRPNAYAPGTMAKIADGYAAAGEPGKAEIARRMAMQEGFLLPFAQASAEKQQGMIDDLPEGELRDTALAIQRHQADAFARDPFAAGTALYRQVGAPVPIDDVAGRVRQAREIAQRRGGIAVVPFTAGEIDVMRQTMAKGTEQQKQAVRARLAGRNGWIQQASLTPTSPIGTMEESETTERRRERILKITPDPGLPALEMPPNWQPPWVPLPQWEPGWIFKPLPPSEDTSPPTAPPPPKAPSPPEVPPHEAPQPERGNLISSPSR